MELYDDIYREWMPHRARDKGYRDGSFFAKLIILARRSPFWQLPDIVLFHQALYENISGVEIPEFYVHPFRDFRPTLPEYSEFKLKDTFAKVFIVLGDEWQERGVILVWLSEADAIRHGCVVTPGGDVNVYDGDDGINLGSARAFRCPLKRAMKLIVATDPERAGPRAEFSGQFEEVLGEVDDDSDDERMGCDDSEQRSSTAVGRGRDST